MVSPMVSVSISLIASETERFHTFIGHLGFLPAHRRYPSTVFWIPLLLLRSWCSFLLPL